MKRASNKILGAAATLATLMPAMTSAAPPLSETIRIAAGTIRGGSRDQHEVLSFKGIPYAAPPIGDLRWRAPQPARPWLDVRDTSRFGNRCFSSLEKDPEPGPPRSEDCLTLNVWTAAHSVGEKRPVMVWVHGGGFQFGSGASAVSNGAALAGEGVVVVSFNYRLGVLGFLASPLLDREGPSGDYGLQDQLAALRWVKANIAAFGGDPGNVTVFGESAGAHAIGILMASPLAKGLFHKAIGASGAFWDGRHGPLESFDEAHARGTAFAARMGATSAAALRALPAEALNAATMWNFSRDPIVTAFSPNIDRHVVPELPAALYAQGKQMRIPLLAGWNATEEWPFRAFDLPHATAAEFRSAAEHLFGVDRMPEFLSFYPAGTDAEANASADVLTGDIVIAEQTWHWLELQRGLKSKAVFGYKFSYTSPYVPIASHLVDVPFVFGTLTPQFIVGGKGPPSNADRALSKTMMAYWVNFATRADPNGPGLPAWPAFGPSGIVQHFDREIAAGTDPQAKRLKFISSFRKAGVLPARWRDY